MSRSMPTRSVDTPRFRPTSEWFVMGRHRGVHSVQVGATAERTVDLLQALALHLDPSVDIQIVDARSGRRWQGAMCALPDVRAELERLRQGLAAYGGVEVSVYTPSDQLTLTAALQLVIYARTNRWAFLLEGAGLVERLAVPPSVWCPGSVPRFSVPSLTETLETTARHLGLEEATA